MVSRRDKPDGVVFEGELDSWNADAVAAALARIGAASGGDFEFDLTGLQFCDVSGIRVIVRTANLFGEERRIVLRGLAPRLRKVLDIVGWGAAPGLLIGLDDDLSRPNTA